MIAFVSVQSPADALNLGDPGQFVPETGVATTAKDLLGCLEKAAIAEYRGNHVRVRRTRPAGCFLFGPYWRLPAGHYRLTFRAAAIRPRRPEAAVLGVEIIALNRLQQAWRDFTAAELAAGTAVLAFTVPPELGLEAGDDARFEFRFFHLGNADLSLAAIALENSDAGEAPAAATRRWRLLGRLRRRAIGIERRAHFRVHRWRRPGVVLALGRPHLQLPAGNYRLTFRAAARRPLLPSQPVLGVAIMAQSRWRDRLARGWKPGLAPTEHQQAWRDFTAAELACGAAAIDFMVPLELAVEAGGEMIFDVRFLHFGNAEWAIDAVELQQLSTAETVCEAAGAWRLFGRLAKERGAAAERGALPRRLGRPQPPVQLPAGYYRLSFAAALAKPLPAAMPVLEVAVIARTRRPGGRSLPQARQSFTAEELRSGDGAIAFSVPAELACEGGGRADFTFVFTALGGAAPAIDSVLLRAVPTAPQAMSAPGPIPGPALGRQARTKVVVVGNCQALTVYEALCRAGSLNTRIEAKYHFVGLQENLHEQGRRELAACDVLLVQEIQDWERYPLRDAVAQRTQIIKFPLLHFASLWPFDHYNGPGDREAYEREWPNLTFPCLDGLLGRLRREIPDREQRFEAYRTLAVTGIVNHVRLHDFERRRLLAMDRKYECNIGRFILDNFQNRQLFYMTCHPNGQVLTLLMRYLVKRLGIDEPYHPRASLDHFRRQQVPVHPKVAKALGVTWAHEKTRYLHDGRTVTWENYARLYIDHYG